MTPEIRHTVITVHELCCATEEMMIRRKLEHLDGVHSLQVNFVSHRLSVQHSGDAQTILNALHDIGLPGALDQPSRSPASPRPAKLQRSLFVISCFSFAAGLALSVTNGSVLLADACFGVAILLTGWDVVRKAWHSLRNRTLDINVLMTLAVTGALALGDTAEGAAVIVLYALSLLLESMSMDRTRHAIRSLMKLSPQTATVLRLSTEVLVATEQILPGEIVRVRPGERVPVDGVVEEGTSSVDQSPITGESAPVTRAKGDPVYAGVFNQRGMLDIRATKPARDSRLAQIVHLVEEAESRRADRQSFIDRFASIYTPSVFALCLFVWMVPPLVLGQPFTQWFYRGLVLLVISCPCALVISTPVTLVSAITNAARHGILVKGGRYLETLAHIRALAVDKTGTLTQARLVVTDIVPLGAMTGREILQIAASIEMRSEHHLADALLQKATRSGVEFRQNIVSQFESIPGKGVRATVDGIPYALGNHQFAEDLNVCSPTIEHRLETLEREGRTAIVLADDQRAVGIIAFADMVRDDSSAAIQALHDLDIRPIVLLTGDNAAAADAVAAELGMDEVRSGLLPEQKTAAVRDLRARHGMVGMVGDGVNDAPALASADVGISMGAAGSDTAIETADIVLMSDDLFKLPHAVALGRSAVRIIKQNVALALLVKGAFLFLGLLGWSSLWLAILADDGVTLLVILNSLRILGFRKPAV